jgi:catechol 2,3-dioxygenase-like lactoylglutathione lyase family enzyme
LQQIIVGCPWIIRARTYVSMMGHDGRTLRGTTVLRLAISALVAMGLARGVAAQEITAPDANVPILGLAGVTIRVSDLEKARRYYDGVLGLAEAFRLKDRAGRATSIFFKVNDDQYVEVVPGLAPNAVNRQVRVLVQSFDLKRLHATYSARGLNPTAIARGPDGNPVFRVVGPDDATLDFIEYAPESQQSRARGKLLEPRRLSRHLQHVGMYARGGDSVRLFFDRLGFPRGRQLPGGRGEWIELLPPSIAARFLQTKFPHLDPNTAAGRAHAERELMGAIQHLAIEVPDMRVARDLAQERGTFTDLQVRVHVGNTRRWLMHLFDPDGACTEFIDIAVQDALPPMTVMAPGRAVAPPILPTTPGEIPWPSPAAAAPSSR